MTDTETDADKIARLEAELAIAKFELRAMKEAYSQRDFKWSPVLVGPPPRGLQNGCWQVAYTDSGWSSPVAWSDAWTDFCDENIRHRIAMNRPILWGGTICPIPRHWTVIPLFKGSTRYGQAQPAGGCPWDEMDAFILVRLH